MRYVLSFSLVFLGSLAFGQSVQKEIERYNDFAFDLLVEAHTLDRNIVMAPASLYLQLTFFFEGRQGAASTDPAEMFGDATLHGLNKVLSLPIHDGNLSVRNALWFQESAAIRTEPAKLFQLDFNGELFKVETFSTAQLQSIADWFGNGDFVKKSKLTGGNLLSGITTDMKGSWAHPFDATKTVPGVFHAPSRDATLPFMQITRRIGTAEIEHARLCELELSNELLLIIVKPNKTYSPTDILATVRPTDIINSNFGQRTTRLGIPKFSIRSDLRVKPLLNDMGFDSFFKTNDLHHLFEDSVVTLDDIFATTSISLSEHGKEAGEGQTGATTRELDILAIDRPFLFFVVARTNRAIIVHGIVQMPE